ncbi:hypothetical protein C8N24_4173 [Solirubrobacter pauli]|uniref:PknH-like protein n=1 Tax=Solirubrobacter pauli TaxID=166793 RepID=A0A660L2I8_9ACTN|nr:hypothetical protein [Solirubrobacter pauli]RKQ86163.1 hypothetical protein C8N24_4173 [Solirubrobacter pauli]
MKTLILTSLAAVLLLAGCGADAPKKTDRAHAESAVLRLADFPSGWRAAEQARTDIKSPCLAVEDAKRAVSGGATSRTFRRGESTQAESSVYVFPDEAAARTAFAGVSADETTSCFGAILAKSIASQPGVQFRKLRLEPIAQAELGDERAARRVIVSAVIDEVDLELIADFVFVRSGRGVSIQSYVDVLQPFGDELRDRLARATAERLEAELRV